MGYINHGGAQLLMQRRQLHPHVGPQLRIQVGQRLVHQKSPGLTHDGAADGHPLLLPAGQLARTAVQKVLDVQHFGGLVHPPGNLVLGHLAHRQRKGHVVVHAHLRIQCVVLEHHGQIPLTGLGVIAQLVAYPQFAFADLLQPGNHAQGGGLAAAGRAHKYDELAIVDVQREIAHRPLALVVYFADILQNDFCHKAFLFPLVFHRAPALSGATLPGTLGMITDFSVPFRRFPVNRL